MGAEYMGSPTITIAKNATIYTVTMNTFTILVTGSILLSNVGAVPGGHYRGGYYRKAAPAPTKTIAELAIATPQLSTLLAAVKAAGLVETLSGEGPFTVFPPTNDAFAKIPADTLNGLLADKEALTAVLLRHVVPGAALKPEMFHMEQLPLRQLGERRLKLPEIDIST